MPQKKGSLKNQIRRLRPTFVFVLETMDSNTSTTRSASYLILGFQHFVQHAQGKLRGFIFQRNEDLDIEILYTLCWIIHFLFRVSNQSPGLYLSLVYSNKKYALRQQQWILLPHFKPPQGNPWLICGDLNDIAYDREKFGGKPISLIKLNNFKKLWDECEVMDQGCKGIGFTLFN